MGILISDIISPFYYGGALIVKDDDTMYAFLIKSEDGYGLLVYKTTSGGTAWSLIYTISHDTMFTADSGYSITGMDAALDGAGFIHVVSVSGSPGSTARNPAYCKFDTSDDSWGSWESIGELDTAGGIKIVIDPNNKPHVLYTKQIALEDYKPIYKNKIGTVWSGMYDFTQIVGSGNLHGASMMMRDNQDIDVLLEKSLVTVIKVSRTNGNWGSPITISGDIVNKNSLVWTNADTLEYFSADSTHVFNNDSNIYDYSLDNRDKYTTIYSKTQSKTIAILAAGGYNNWHFEIMTKKDGDVWSGRRDTTATVLYSGGFYWQLNTPIVDYGNFHMYTNPTKIHFIYGADDINYTYYGYGIIGSDIAPPTIHSYIEGHGHILHPDEDITISGNWVTDTGITVLYPPLADSSDANYVHIMSGGYINDYFEVGLESPSGNVTGAHILTWKAYKKAGTRTAQLNCELRQGSTIIASGVRTIIASGVQEYNMDLTAAQIANITDYTDLRLRITVLNIT